MAPARLEEALESVHLEQTSDQHASDQMINAEALAELVEQAERRIRGKVVRTPVVRLPWLDREEGEGLKVWAKLDCHQHSGSFKFRGALNALVRSGSQRVVTASAGNHALALCAAARATGKTAHIVLPTGVSEIKAKRIMAEADQVSFSGKDLFEATHTAKKIAAARGDHYVSPFADVDVAAGAGSIMMESTADAGEFDAVVVPLGGGGLAAGVAAWCAVHSPRTKVIVAHPAIFGRIEDDQSISAALSRPTNPTVCDGLAVQWVEESPLAGVLDALIKHTIAVSEEQVMAAVAEALRFQSLLLEGSAAASIAGLHQMSSGISGRVLLLFTGQNIAPTSIARALVQNIDDSDMRRRAGLSNIFNPANRHNGTGPGNLLDAANGSVGKDVTTSEQESGLQITHSLIDRLLQKVDKHAEIVAQHRALVVQLALRRDPWCESIGDDSLSQVRTLASALKTDVEQGRVSVWVAEERYRLILQLYSTACSLFERASPSYDQALTDWFGDAAHQNSAMVNYDRYGAIQLRDAERMLLDTLRPSERQDVNLSLMLTSSGMAAYQVFQHYLMQRLHQSDTVLLSPYIYFEAMEQLQSFARAGSFQLHQCSSYDVEVIASEAESRDARVVFLDPVANVVGLPISDIKRFAQLVSSREGWEKRTVVIDGTMVSGGLRVFDWFDGPHAPQVLYSESASKYTQLGLDLQMAGVVVFRSNLEADMWKIRRDLGAVMYSRGIHLLPQLDFALYQRRMTLVSENAMTLVRLVSAGFSSSEATIAYPPWKALGWRHGGAVVTIEFTEQGLNNREGLDACIELVLSNAKNEGVPITKGVSFGFSTSRISASSSMAEGSAPFLRVSVGAERCHVAPLAVALERSLRTYLDEFSS
ncbi:pyridoxal-5 -phosphate-dependent beta subunit [Lecanosticta acicola]|uniref:Pyridoxal-5 -phosphate-dependent beta subunit n=1 Tax=Lecanosticta acicola TaxID=111012 RepID=A0AAI8W134_9PEZI|nr:pyridoxal-5 -phosphate-dependent beta subunit [Lecanosticta acicola]